MKLSPRLALVASKVPVSGTVYDIGTDHAYIPIYLIENDRCSKAVACDIRKGPILVAKKNIENSQIKNKIQTRLGSGLAAVYSDFDDVNKSDIDSDFSIVIAGMGGKLITDILEQDKQEKQAARKCKALVIQPNNAIELVRRWLCENGFDIVDEELCAEDERFYNVIVATYSGISTTLQDIYYYIGKKLIEKKDPLLAKYISKKVKKFNEIIKEIEDNGKENVKAHEKAIGKALRKENGIANESILNEIKSLKDDFETVRRMLNRQGFY